MKYKRNLLIAVILLLVIIGIAVTACGSPESLVGRWTYVLDTSNYMEFFSDGRVEIGDAENTYTGTYEAREGYQISIVLEGMFEGPEGEYGVANAIYEIDDDILTFTVQNQVSTWRRAE